MKAEIITIGDEILIGQIVDTNSAWMGQQLNLHGIEVYQVTSVHDNHEHIMAALANAEKNADLVLITGGLAQPRMILPKTAFVSISKQNWYSIPKCWNMYVRFYLHEM